MGLNPRIITIAKSTLSSAGVLNYGSVTGYVGAMGRRALNMGLASLQDNTQAYYFAKDCHIWKRALKQILFQTAYGMLRSYPRYIRYWEQVERDKYIMTKAQSSIANKTGQYFQLIKDQQAIGKKKNHADTIVGRVVHDFLELEIKKEGSYFDSKTEKVEQNEKYGLVSFVDLQPSIQVSSKNNIVLTNVQGRDFTRKEFISGGDFEISITGKITSKYPDVYPEAEVSKFLKLIMYKGVIDCDNTVLRQFKISQLIIQNYTLSPTEYRNIQNYTMSCVAVEPSEAIELIIKDQEVVDTAIKHTNKWIKWVKLGAEVISPESLLKFAWL